MIGVASESASAIQGSSAEVRQYTIRLANQRIPKIEWIKLDCFFQQDDFDCRHEDVDLHARVEQTGLGIGSPLGSADSTD